MGLGLLYELLRSHSDTPHSVGLLWTGDRPVAETPTWQHTTPARERERHPCPQQDSNPQSQQASGRRPTPETARPLVSAQDRSTKSNLFEQSHLSWRVTAILTTIENTSLGNKGRNSNGMCVKRNTSTFNFCSTPVTFYWTKEWFIKTNTETVRVAYKEFGLEVKAEKIKYADITRVQDKFQNLFCDKSTNW